MKINEEFLDELKPEEMSNDEWITLVLQCLANENHYMSKCVLDKKIKRDSKNSEKYRLM